MGSLIIAALAWAIPTNAYSKRVDVYGTCEDEKYSIKMHYHRPPTMTSQDQEVLNKCNNDSPGLHGWECEVSCENGPKLCEEIYEMVEKKGPAMNHCKKTTEGSTKTKSTTSESSEVTGVSRENDEGDDVGGKDNGSRVSGGMGAALLGTAVMTGMLII
jgi:hypothetical protein